MQLFVDNFLPEELFISLNKRMLWRYRPNLRQDKGVYLNGGNNAAVRIRTSTDGFNFEESAVLLGAMVPEIIEFTKNYLINQLNFKNPLPYSIWFQYMSNKQSVGPHYDNKNIRGKLPTQCFSTFIYSHEKWEDDWGGELCFHATKILPKKNRMIMYSRDEEHWVSDIKHNSDDYQRMFLGFSWSTENDF